MKTVGEWPDRYVTLLRASEMAGVNQETLRVHAVRGRLRSVRRGGAYFTTARWLHQYLAGRDDTGNTVPAPLTADDHSPE